MSSRTSSRDRVAAKNRRTRVIVLVMAGLMVFSLVGAALGGLFGGGEPTPTVDEDQQAALDELEEELERLQEGPPEDVEPCPSPEDAPEPSGQQYAEPPLAELEGDPVTVTLVTTCGDIVIELDPELAPVAAANMAGLALDGFYDGTTFHRTQWNFVIQGGDPVGDGSGGPGYTIDDELEDLDRAAEPMEGQDLLRYPRGAVAMANRGPDTAGSQFFVVQAEDYPFPPAYTIFGQVVEGMDVVDRIAAGEQEQTVATDPVVITEARVDGASPGEVVPAEDAETTGDGGTGGDGTDEGEADADASADEAADDASADDDGADSEATDAGTEGG